ncbi:MAG: hypothetical protein Q9183_001987 [Haloplaca sp. 2 TL-2023]
MASSNSPPTPNWRTHPLKQKLLNPFSKQAETAPADLASTSANATMNAVYYPNWKVYGPSPPSSLNVEHITHAYYAFAFLKPDGTVYSSDEQADLHSAVDGTTGGLNAFRNLKRDHPQLKTLLSIGGGGKGSEPFAGVAHSSASREKFAATAKNMLDKYDFDGIDIDWEHPENPGQGADYNSLLALLRKKLPAPNYLITSALPAGAWALKNINLGKASGYLDYINLMAYDFVGPWTSVSGYHAQLHTPARATGEIEVSGQSAVRYMVNAGVPIKKIVLGVPAYGRSFMGVSSINQRHTGSGGEEGTFEYKDLPRPGTKEQVDYSIGAAFCIGGDGGLVTYDNPETVRMKADYVKQYKLGGLFYWTGPGDAKGSRSLVTAGYDGLKG